jgi:predicted metalloprotease with PDZ domain
MAAGKPPHKSYLFMLNAVDDGYGGLEHRNSTALICGRRDLPRLGPKRKPATATPRCSGLISHEYFHTWNVKRLRPAEFARYDYAAGELHPAAVVLRGLHQLLRRPAAAPRRPDRRRAYLKLLTKTINQVLQTPGRQCSRWRRPALTPG